MTLAGGRAVGRVRMHFLFSGYLHIGNEEWEKKKNDKCFVISFILTFRLFFF